MESPVLDLERKKKNTRKKKTQPQIQARETGVSPMPRNP
jgi:hypothetical protein